MELGRLGVWTFLDAMSASDAAASTIGASSGASAHYAAGADHVCIQPLRPDGQPGPDPRALDALAPARR